jgi:hypothetical protein
VIVKFGCADIPYSNNTTTQKRKLVVDGALISQGLHRNRSSLLPNGMMCTAGTVTATRRHIAGPRDWGYVRINASGSVVEYCQFWYGGLGYAVGQSIMAY